MNVINKLTRLLFNEKRYKRKYTNNDQHYYKLKANKRLILCINVGRSGTRWLADIFNEHEGVVGTCERAVEYESFYRYVNWYDLDIDLTNDDLLFTIISFVVLFLVEFIITYIVISYYKLLKNLLNIEVKYLQTNYDVQKQFICNY